MKIRKCLVRLGPEHHQCQVYSAAGAWWPHGPYLLSVVTMSDPQTG